MRCPQCAFENMPGMQRCLRCGNALELPGPARCDPPRMARWKKPFRQFIRSVRAIFPAADRWLSRLPLPGSGALQAALSYGKDVLNDYAVVMFLSLAPGLGHAIHRNFRTIRWVWLAWLVCLIGGLFFFPTGSGLALFGIALALHAWMIFHAAIKEVLPRFWQRMIVVPVLTLGVFLFYRLIASALQLGGAAAPMAWPAYGCEQGDYLLTWRSEAAYPWQRGDLAVCRFRRVYNQTVQDMATVTVGQVVGLPGETLTMEQGRFLIDGQPLDQERYPIPTWLQGGDYSVIIPADTYCVMMNYNVRVNHGANINLNGVVTRMCLYSRHDLFARPFMTWWPLSRRGFLKDIE